MTSDKTISWHMEAERVVFKHMTPDKNNIIAHDNIPVARHPTRTMLL